MTDNNIIHSEGEDSQIVLYQPDESIRLEVKLEQETVWLNRQQISQLFGRDIKTIGKHINNALREELAPEPTDASFATLQSVGANFATTEKKPNPVVTKFATTAADGKTYQVEYYNLDVVLSVGFRHHADGYVAGGYSCRGRKGKLVRTRNSRINRAFGKNRCAMMVYNRS